MTIHLPQPSPFLEFTRRQWMHRRDSTPLTLTRADVERLRGVNEPIDLTEVEEIYLPLSRLLSLHVAAVQELHGATGTFLRRRTPKVPYIIGVGRQRGSRQEHIRPGCCRPCWPGGPGIPGWSWTPRMGSSTRPGCSIDWG